MTVSDHTVNGLCLDKKDKVTNTSFGKVCDTLIESKQVFVRERTEKVLGGGGRLHIC